MTAEVAFDRVSRTKGREATLGVIPGRFALAVGRPDLPAPRGWRWTSLSSVAQLESGHTPSRKHSDYWDGGIPWVSIKDAVDNHGRTINDTHQHVSRLGLENSSARLLPPRTVCLSRTASVGYVVVMGREMATSQDFVNWVCGPRINPDFLKYVLLGEHDSLLRFASGTTHQTIYYPEAKAFHVLLPPPAEQGGIAAVLSALDDKIDVNRRLNKALEEMASALYRSWFVDFDPVHAKAAGKKPFGMSDVTAALFPTRFQPSALGPIPLGWEQAALGDVLLLKRGYDLPKEQRRPGPVPICSSSGISGWHDEAKASGPGVVTGRYGTVGQVFFLEGAYWPLNTTLYVNKFTRVLPRIAYYLLTGINFQTYADKAAVPGINRNDVHKEPIVLGPPSIQMQFDSAVEPLLRLARANREQTTTLSAIRDALLPNLLSGGVRLKDAERLAGDAT